MPEKCSLRTAQSQRERGNKTGTERGVRRGVVVSTIAVRREGGEERFVLYVSGVDGRWHAAAGAICTMNENRRGV